MPRKASTAVDPVKLVELLWTPSQAIGRSGVTLAGITAAAVQIADAEGLDAVTMRRVAEQVGVGAMSVYTYVPGRAELVELMLDRVAAQVYDDRPLPCDQGGWRAGMEYVSRANWEHLQRHPWASDVPPGRPILGPGVSTKFEVELQPLDGVGLDDHAMNHLLACVLGLTTQAARWDASLRRSRADSGLTDQEWWDRTGPQLGEAMKGVELPVASRVGETVASAGDPEDSLRFGLTHLLDGVAATLHPRPL